MNKLSEKYCADRLLEEILVKKNNPKLTKKIHGTIHKFYERIGVLTDINKEYKEYFLKFLLHDTKKNIKLNKYDDEVESFLLNNITAIYRLELMTKTVRII